MYLIFFFGALNPLHTKCDVLLWAQRTSQQVVQGKLGSVLKTMHNCWYIEASGLYALFLATKMYLPSHN